MKRIKPLYRHSVLIHDGQEWLLFSGDEYNATLRVNALGTAEHIPDSILEKASEEHIQDVRILLSGEVQRLETDLPSKLNFAEVNRIIAAEVGDMSSVDPSALLTAGGRFKRFGRKDHVVLSGVFSQPKIEDYHHQLQDMGIHLGGVASLELACMVTWQSFQQKQLETFVIVGHTYDFVMSGKKSLDNPGPVSFSGGSRYWDMDEAEWLTRFQRSTRFLDKRLPLHVLTLSSSHTGVESTLRQGGYENLQRVERDGFYALAAQSVMTVAANSLRASIPVVNPYEPRKRFSHAWIIIPSLMIMCAPFIYQYHEETRSEGRTKSYQNEAAQYLPLEKAMKTAIQNKQSAQRVYQTEISLQHALANKRKPMVAFIHVSYFFCKYAGHSVMLNQITEGQDEVSAVGTFSDPEDGVRLNEDLGYFTKKMGLRIRQANVSESLDEEGNVLSQFEFVFNYENLKDQKK